MRLVGAPEFTIRLPLILQGGAQGLLGALLAIALLAAAYRLVAPHLDALVNVTLGISALRFFTAPAVLTLLIMGILLGGVGGVLARTPRDARA